MRITKDTYILDFEKVKVLISEGEISQARDLLSKAIELAPDNYKARNLLRATFENPALGSAIDVKSDRHACPCCNITFASFLPGGPSYRPKACCPACESLERHRLMCLLLARTSLFKGPSANLVHIAPEACLQKRFGSNFGNRYHTMDLMPKADIQADICALPLADESVAVIMANHVLEHVRDDLAAIHEIHRVLTRRGLAILQVPMDKTLFSTPEAPEGALPGDSLRLFGQEDHVRMYGADFPDRLGSTGFKVREYICRDIASENEIQLFGLISNESIWVAKKT